MLDLLITGGQYPNFDRMNMVFGDVGIRDGRIVSIGSIAEDARVTFDASGKVVSPGFIDIHMHEENFREEGLKYVIAERMLCMGVTTCVGGNCGLQHQSVTEFCKGIEQLSGAPVNYLMMAGYNSARTSLGIGHREEISPEKAEQIRRMLSKELDDGAIGISFGLEYDPGITYDEVIQTLEYFREKDLLISMHYRDDSTGSPNAVREMLDMAEAWGKRFQISHLSSCSAMGQMKDALGEINAAIRKNPGIDYDTYPYSAFSTHIGSEVFAAGCFEKWKKDWGCLMLTEEPFKGKFCDQELFELARKEYPDMLAVAFVMNEDEITDAIINSYGMIASDGIINNGNGHPRAAGTFPRVLGKYVRQEKCISLIDALAKMTKLPAQRLKLQRKGEIKEGYDGDITVFDPDVIEDAATFENPSLRPKGIEGIWIGGKTAVRNGEIINGRLGSFQK